MKNYFSIIWDFFQSDKRDIEKRLEPQVLLLMKRGHSQVQNFIKPDGNVFQQWSSVDSTSTEHLPQLSVQQCETDSPIATTRAISKCMEQENLSNTGNDGDSDESNTYKHRSYSQHFTKRLRRQEQKVSAAPPTEKFQQVTDRSIEHGHSASKDTVPLTLPSGIATQVVQQNRPDILKVTFRHADSPQLFQMTC